MNILLYAPEYRPNLSNMIRSAEFFGLDKIYIWDKNELLSPPKNKATRADMNHMARVWTAGAIEYMDIISIEEVPVFLQDYTGRTLATVIDPSATPLDAFVFEKEDLIIMGSEKEGLPAEIVNLCDAAVHLPAVGHTDCLNVSVSLGIFLYAAQQQRE
jgi:tRNA G18 (ribose-2'-O)-methylase SpoU